MFPPWFGHKVYQFITSSVATLQDVFLMKATGAMKVKELKAAIAKDGHAENVGLQKWSERKKTRHE